MQWDGNPSNDDDLTSRRNRGLKDIKQGLVIFLKICMNTCGRLLTLTFLRFLNYTQDVLK